MFDLDRYLERIGYEGPTEPSRETLDALHESHVAAIPFENLDILLGRPILLDLDSLQRKLVDERRGGYCFEQNTLFRAALEAIGFLVTSLAARVRVGPPVVRPRTHMLLRVELPEGPFLADVGFGGDGLMRPLPLEAGPELAIGPSVHRLRREAEAFVLEGKFAGNGGGEGAGEWSDLYLFTLEPHYPIDFEMANHFTSTYPTSIFRNSLTAQRSRRDRRAILRNRELVLRGVGATETVAVRDPDELLEILEHHFGLAFPAGTRFAKPEF
jgi:N-hydroxyarylamine O-acetyltransferase